MDYMKEMCKDLIEIGDINEINCIDGYNEENYCISCPFAKVNNNDGLLCGQRSKEKNIEIAKKYLKEKSNEFFKR